VQFDGVEHSVTVLVRPALRQGRALVLFWEHDESPATAQNGAAANGQDGRAARFEAQLLLSEQQLQSSKEQYESSVEELSAANEELQSTNEEYRSTLEELETSKEELQSINEELQSVNQELKVRVEEIATANSDLQNLFAATEIATLFLDRDLCVKRYTPRAAELFNLMPSDQGRPIWHLRSKLDYSTLDVDVRRVLSTLIPLEHKILAEDQRWFLVGLRPYRTVEDRIDGVVITCVDITADKANELELRRREEQYRSLFESIDEGFCRIEVIFDAHDRPVDYRFLEVNPAFERHTGLHEATGRTMRELAPDHEQHWFDIYGDIALTGESRRFQNQAAALGCWYDVYAFRFGEPERRQVAVLFRDVTERHEMEEQLETKVVERTAQVRTLVTQLTVSEQEERRRISAILHDDLQQRLFSLNVQLAMLRQMLDANELGNARQVIDEIGGALRESVKVTRSLSVSLSPPVLHDEGLFEAVRWLASLMQQQHGLTVAVKAEQPLPPLGEDLRVLLFQLVRELLFNVVKHAGVAEATVSLAQEDNHLRITVSDYGNGFDPRTGVAQINSQGLPRAERRLHLIGGRVQIQSTPGQGTCVTIYVPQHHEDGE
jgi:two-component system CheB/CheR fusion protein